MLLAGKLVRVCFVMLSTSGVDFSIVHVLCLSTTAHGKANSGDVQRMLEQGNRKVDSTILCCSPTLRMPDCKLAQTQGGFSGQPKSANDIL